MKQLPIEYLSSREAAKFLGVSYKQIRNLTASRKITSYKVGRLNRYKLSDLREFIEKSKREALYD